jgi:hypothetical protein
MILNTLIPLLTFILADKEVRTLEYRYGRQAVPKMPTFGQDNADLGLPLNPDNTQ